jgi:hypothetical protein
MENVDAVDIMEHIDALLGGQGRYYILVSSIDRRCVFGVYR